MDGYAPLFTITPEILNSAYEIAADLERIDVIREKVLTPQLRKENRIKTIHSSLCIAANSLTLEQVTDIVDGKLVSGPKKEKHQNSASRNAGVNEDVNAGVKLSKMQEKILRLIAKNGSISQSEIAERMSVSRSTIYRNIEKLKRLGVLLRRGSDKAGVWVIEDGR